MINKYLELGQIVGTHGIKGELRFQPWCDSVSFVNQFDKLYLDPLGAKEIKVLASRSHGNIALLTLEGIDSVEKAASFRDKVFYIDRNDSHIPKNSFFVADLLGCEVKDRRTGEVYGKVSDVSKTGANDVWHIKNDENREFLFPAVKEFVCEINVRDNYIIIEPIKGIFDDEN